MIENAISTQHKQAVELHQKIIISATFAQQNLWDMCTSLKKMRDGKLYKELGYQNFEDYCENEVGMERRNVYRYISVVEKVSSENVTSMSQIGMTKLSLLASISEQEQAEIAEKIDLEETTVKQLKAEIDKLKQEKASAEQQKKNVSEAYEHLEAVNKEHFKNLCEEKNKNREMERKIEELESRPIEVAVADDSDNERRLQETIKSLERENIRHYDQLEAQYREDEKSVRKMLEQEKQEALADLKAEYEQKLSKNNAQVSDKYISYMAALKNADNALKALVTCCAILVSAENEHTQKVKSSIDKLISNFNKNINLAI